MNKDFLEKEAKSLLESLQVDAVERRAIGLLGPFLQVLFVGMPQKSQTKVLRVMYDYQLIKQRELDGDKDNESGSTEGDKTT